jgi:hypothetical protein
MAKAFYFLRQYCVHRIDGDWPRCRLIGSQQIVFRNGFYKQTLLATVKPRMERFYNTLQTLLTKESDEERLGLENERAQRLSEQSRLPQKLTSSQLRSRRSATRKIAARNAAMIPEAVATTTSVQTETVEYVQVIRKESQHTTTDAIATATTVVTLESPRPIVSTLLRVMLIILLL